MQKALMVAVATLVMGCVAGEPVQIVTVKLVGSDGMDGCYLMGPTGRLVTDPVYGTAFEEAWPSWAGPTPPGWSPEPQAVAWPEGYTARWAGTDIEVLDQYGSLVAKTGARYEIAPPASIWDLTFPDGFTGVIGVADCITPR